MGPGLQSHDLDGTEILPRLPASKRLRQTLHPAVGSSPTAITWVHPQERSYMRSMLGQDWTQRPLVFLLIISWSPAFPKAKRRCTMCQSTAVPSPRSSGGCFHIRYTQQSSATDEVASPPKPSRDMSNLRKVGVRAGLLFGGPCQANLGSARKTVNKVRLPCSVEDCTGSRRSLSMDTTEGGCSAFN